jgi:hypothetical protein
MEELYLLHRYSARLRFRAWNIRGQLQCDEQYHAVHGSQRILSWNCRGGQPREPDDVPVVELHASSWHLYHQRTACYLPERHLTCRGIFVDIGGELCGFGTWLRLSIEWFLYQSGGRYKLHVCKYLLPWPARRFRYKSAEQPDSFCNAILCFYRGVQC